LARKRHSLATIARRARNSAKHTKKEVQMSNRFTSSNKEEFYEHLGSLVEYYYKTVDEIEQSDLSSSDKNWNVFCLRSAVANIFGMEDRLGSHLIAKSTKKMQKEQENDE
jgi:hypothetical protein